MDKFEIGEVAILWKPGAINHGKECTIIGPLRMVECQGMWSGDVIEELCYQVDYGPGFVYGPFHSKGARQWCSPKHLRKKRPPEQPREQLGEWALCPWQPKQTVKECFDKLHADLMEALRT